MKTIYAKFVFLLCIAFFMSGCVLTDDMEHDTEPEPPEDTTVYSIDGYWDRGDLVLYIEGAEGTFVQINYGSWENALQNGFVSIGSLKFKDIYKTDDNEYAGANLWLKKSGGNVIGVKWSINNAFIIENGGVTLLLNTYDPWDFDGWSVDEYTRINP